MSTTALKLPLELKQRAATAAQELGISSHAFMVEAIWQAADAVEQRSKFVAEALAPRALYSYETDFDAVLVRAVRH